MTPPISEQIAVVTGANRGLGLAISQALAGAGMHVVLTGRDKELVEAARQDLAASGLPVSSAVLDITDEESVSRAMKQITNEHGHIDVLINNAAIVGDKGQLASHPDFARVGAILDTNLLGAWRCIAAVSGPMTERGFGRIVNISSHLGSTTAEGAKGGVTYRIAKTALGALTRIAAVELEGTGVLINACSPGRMNTRIGMGEDLIEPGQAAESMLWLATLPEDGPTGGFWYGSDRLAW